MRTERLPTERSFGLGVGGVSLALATVFWWRESSTVAMVLTAVGAVLVALGAMAPSMLRVPNRLWWRFAQAIGWINSRVILTVFFALILTPVGVVTRLFGRNPLRAAEPATNWRPYSSRRIDPKHYEHLF